MKSILVTGGCGGIGAAICEEFAKCGYSVAVHYHTQEEKANKLAQTLSEKYGVKTVAVYADVSDCNSVGKMFDSIEQKFGQIDCLVNNAGIAQQKLFTEITDIEWKKMLGTNLDGVFYCCSQALKRFMLPNHSGSIVNISSMWGQTGASCEVHYSAAKAGVIGLTKALAKEIGLSGIRVNCICPGIIMTDMMKGFDAETLDNLKEETPLNKLGTPEDIAHMTAFLCTDKARFITGQVIGINGGFVI